MIHEHERTAGEPTGAPGARQGEPTSGSGSRAHIRETLERARAAIGDAFDGAARSRVVLARSEALAGAAGRAAQESAALRAELRASVAAYARRLRGEGMPPERMLVLVKHAVRDAIPPELEPLEARALMEDVVRWSIEAYYDAA